MSDHSATPSSIAAGASPEEAAAIVAALERFMRATQPAPEPSRQTGEDEWRAAAVQEGLSRAERHDLPDPWINA